MNNYSRVETPRSDAKLEKDDCSNDDQDAAVTSIADNSQARCLRNGLILANIVAWLVILVVLKVLVLG